MMNALFMINFQRELNTQDALIVSSGLSTRDH